MPQYSISFKSSAAKELKKLPLELQHRIANKIEQLVEDPRLSGVIKLKGMMICIVVELVNTDWFTRSMTRRKKLLLLE